MDDARDTHGTSGVVSGTTTVSCSFPIADSGGLSITEIRISPRGEDKLKAFVSITLEESFVIRGIKIIEGRERLFVAMPSRSRTDGTFQDIVHPINQSTRSRLESHILDAYYGVMEGKDVH